MKKYIELTQQERMAYDDIVASFRLGFINAVEAFGKIAGLCQCSHNDIPVEHLDIYEDISDKVHRLNEADLEIFDMFEDPEIKELHKHIFEVIQKYDEDMIDPLHHLMAVIEDLD